MYQDGPPRDDAGAICGPMWEQHCVVDWECNYEGSPCSFDAAGICKIAAWPQALCEQEEARYPSDSENNGS